jgi:hypothetical protein
MQQKLAEIKQKALEAISNSENIKKLDEVRLAV